MIFSLNAHKHPQSCTLLCLAKSTYIISKKNQLKINLTVNVNNREIAGQNFCNHDNTCRRRFLSISGQKYAEIGIELGLANVLDNFVLALSLAYKMNSYRSFFKNNVKDVT